MVAVAGLPVQVPFKSHAKARPGKKAAAAKIPKSKKCVRGDFMLGVLNCNRDVPYKNCGNDEPVFLFPEGIAG